jgi:hypothetical protein
MPLKQYDQIVLSQLEEKDLNEVLKCIAAEPRDFEDVLENPSSLDSGWLGKPRFGSRTVYNFEEVMGMLAQPVAEDSHYQLITSKDHILPVARGSHAIFIKFKEKVAAFEDLLLKCEEPDAASDMTPEKYLMEQEAAISAYEFNIDSLLENIQAALSFTGDTMKQMATTAALKERMATLRDDENERKDVMRILASSLQYFIVVKKVKETKDLSLLAIDDQIKAIAKGKKIPAALQAQRTKASAETKEAEEELNVAKKSIQDLDKKRPIDYPFTTAETNAYTYIFGKDAAKKISNTKEESRVKTDVVLTKSREDILKACEAAEKEYLESQVENSNTKQVFIKTIKDLVVGPYKIENEKYIQQAMLEIHAIQAKELMEKIKADEAELAEKQSSFLSKVAGAAAAAASIVGTAVVEVVKAAFQAPPPAPLCVLKEEVMTVNEKVNTIRGMKISLEKNRGLIDSLVTFPSVYSTAYLDPKNIDECKEIGFPAKRKTTVTKPEKRDNSKENTQFLLPTFETWIYENKV